MPQSYNRRSLPDCDYEHDPHAKRKMPADAMAGYHQIQLPRWEIGCAVNMQITAQPIN